jgi:hypothetical protein
VVQYWAVEKQRCWDRSEKVITKRAPQLARSFCLSSSELFRWWIDEGRLDARPVASAALASFDVAACLPLLLPNPPPNTRPVGWFADRAAITLTYARSMRRPVEDDAWVMWRS